MRSVAWQAGVRRFVADDAKQNRLRTTRTAKKKFKTRARLSVWGRGATDDPSAPPALWFCVGSAFKPHPQSTPAPAEHARVSR
jgi:hypothetical protein